MAAHMKASPPRLNASDLARVGFSPLEIDSLRIMRDRYDPAIEQMATHAEWRRVQFLRWLYQHGVYPHG